MSAFLYGVFGVLGVLSTCVAIYGIFWTAGYIRESLYWRRQRRAYAEEQVVKRAQWESRR